LAETSGLWSALEARAAETPDALFAVDDRDRRLSFAELRRRAERTAAALHARGVSAGTPVSWQLPTWLESLVLTLALARLSAVQNPILPILRAREVGHAVRRTGARLLVVPPAWRGFDHGAMAEAFAAETPGLEVLQVDDGEGAEGAPLPEADPAGLGLMGRETLPKVQVGQGIGR